MNMPRLSPPENRKLRWLPVALMGAFLALGAATAQTPAGGTASSGDDELFGSEEVTQAAVPEAKPKNDFLKYDLVKVGGSISSSLGGSAGWDDPWGGSFDLFAPDSTRLTPALSGKVTLVAKPVEDFGVNADFRFSYPFVSSATYLSGATYKADNPYTPLLVDPYVSTTSGTISAPNISIRSFYSKFSFKDSLFMSFGKQPIAWGVSKGFFQPADDIFALSSVDFSDTAAEREGPLAFKAMYSVPRTMTNFYFLAGFPQSTNTSDPYKFEDVRLALKAEFSFGNTELALAGFYGKNDNPRAILMATTGTGDFNFYGEAIAKYGSERYFIAKNGSTNASLWTSAQKTEDFFFTGTLGGFYTNSDSNITISAQVLYNGESQGEVSAQEAYSWYLLHSSEADRSRLSPWYAGITFSKSKLFTDDLSVSLYGVTNLSDLSGMIVPSISYAFTDYSNVKLSANFTFGAAEGEFLINGPDNRYIATHSVLTSLPPVLAFDTTPGAAVSLTFTLGAGSF